MKYVNKRKGYEGYHVIWEIVGTWGIWEVGRASNVFFIILYPEYSSIFTLRFILISFVTVEIKFGVYIYYILPPFQNECRSRLLHIY